MIEDKFKTLESYYEDDQIAIDTLKSKYLAPNEENLLDMWNRLSKGASEPEEDKDYWGSKFFDILLDFKFIPGGRINFALGRNDIKATLSNCYVVPIKDDSLHSIYKALEEEARTYKYGGGVGHDLSILRPKGTEIKGTGGDSCGPTGFMNLYSVSTKTVRQRNRRGANMQSILVSHPDIRDFINIKDDARKVIKDLEILASKLPQNSEQINSIYEYIEANRIISDSNISVKLTDEFLSAVEKDEDFDLTWGGEIYETVKAREIWDLIIEKAWSSAEPGLLFWNRITENNNLEYFNPVVSTNPCSELPLGAYGNCLLGHANLDRYCELDSSTYKFNYNKFENDIKIMVRFLDNIITINDGRHAVEEQNIVAKNERRIGLGITGLGDALIKLGLRYGSDESIQFIDHTMAVFRNSAYSASCDLAEERGAFPAFDEKGFFQSLFAQNLPSDIKQRIKTNGIRNGMLLTVAPVGTGSIIAQVSSGIEPMFRKSYTRRVRNTNDEYNIYKVVHPLIEKLFKDNNNLPDYVVDSTEISPKERIRVQATIQKYIDNSISSTVNLPKNATKEDVSEVYLHSWRMKCKGVTVYREGSRRGILVSDEGNFGVGSDIDEMGYNALKRPLKLQGETYKKKIDLNGSDPYNCYITVNFIPGTKKPYEVLISEPHTEKDMRDVMMLEFATRCTSMMLRHNVPLKFIIEQFMKVNGQYLYSVPLQISNVLRNYLPESLEEEFEQCPECGEMTLKTEGGCCNCINEECLYSKCDG
jgi:ribonucleoside-diphosphate reductase alpha chain